MKYWLIMGAVIAMGGLIHLFDDFVRKHAIEVEEGSMAGLNRWIAWGKIVPLSRRPEATFSFVLIRLPSWQFREDYNSHLPHKLRWFQRALWRFNGTWRTTWMPDL